MQLNSLTIVNENGLQNCKLFVKRLVLALDLQQIDSY